MPVEPPVTRAYRPDICAAVVMTANLDIDGSVKVKSEAGQKCESEKLSTATGVSTRALRYYEQQGLIRSQRRANGYREYGPEAVDVVAFVQDLFAVGLSSRLLREIIPCAVGTATGRHRQICSPRSRRSGTTWCSKNSVFDRDDRPSTTTSPPARHLGTRAT
ncbi:MerR family transcriptional regulator [Curtobacterium flaccumfaciens]|nr:MerR family transcriptional regulator [Curtobacterium flaccumfaciens]